MTEVKDVYATLAKHHSETHPFAVVIRFTNGAESQEYGCRSLRDCLLVGNGMLGALAATSAGGQTYTVNVVFDARFDHG